MTMPGVRTPVYPGTSAVQQPFKPVTVINVNKDTLKAIVRDSFGALFEVRCDIMRAKGNLPEQGEQWIIDRQYGDWVFGAILNGGSRGVVVPQDNVHGLPEIITAYDDRMTGIANDAQANNSALQAATTGQALAKGDLLAAPAAGQVQRLAVGLTNLQTLVPDASQPTGLAWKTPLALPQALTGATAAGRYVGQTTTAAAPTTGAFLAGDWVRDANGLTWVCTVSGSPGTWVSGAATRLNGVEGRSTSLEGRSTSLEGRATSLESATSDLIGSGKHIWYANGRALNGSGSDVILTTWSQYYSDGIAQLGSGNGLFQFNQPGKWSLQFSGQSDAGNSGAMVWRIFAGSPNPWGSGGNTWLQARGYRGAGFAGAGFMTNNIAWTGRVASSDALQAFAVHAQWYCNPSSVVNATLDYWMCLEYLGPA